MICLMADNTQEDIREIIKKEFVKCSMSAEYFMTKYCYIQVPGTGRQLFSLYDYQKEALKNIEENRYNIVLKARQIGISTLVAGYALWRMIFHTDENILVIAIKQDVAKNLVSKVRFMHEMLPVWLRGSLVEDNKLSLKFGNGSTIKATATSEDSGRSEALSLLVLDEAAFIANAEKIWTAAQATLSTTGGSAILISTPNGMGNFFHQTWTQSEEGLNTFKRTFLDWKVHPDRDQEWYEDQMAVMSEMQFAQEYGASFIFSGNTVVDGKILDDYRKKFVSEPLEKRGFDRNLWIWDYPRAGQSYILCADVARADGLDYSSFHVIDAETSEQVAEYKGKVNPKDFGNMLVAVGTEYNNALLIVDNSNIGHTAIQQIIDRSYSNLFYMTNDLQVVDVNAQIRNRRSGTGKIVPGFSITNRTRPIIIARLQEYFSDYSVLIRSTRTITELQTFVWKNGRAEATEGYNDDLTMALAIGLWVRDTALRLRAQGIELNKSMLSGIRTLNTPMKTGDKTKEHGWKMDIGEQNEDLKWLL